MNPKKVLKISAKTGISIAIIILLLLLAFSYIFPADEITTVKGFWALASPDAKLIFVGLMFVGLWRD